DGHGRSFPRFLNSLDDHFLARLQSFGDLPHRADALAHSHRTNADLVVLIDNSDLETALQFVHRFLWDDERVLHRVRDEADLPKLSRPQSGIWIWKRHVVADRSCFWIEISIQRVELSFSRIDTAAAEN